MATRGGRRSGTPGKAYGNRTDLNMVHAPQTGLETAAAGGVQAPSPVSTPPAEAPGVHPDSVLPLDAPTQRPQEPVTAGMPLGPGVGPTNQVRADLVGMSKYLPLLKFLANNPDTPQSVVAFYNHLSSMTP